MLTCKDLEAATDLIHEGVRESIFKDSTFDRLAFIEYVVKNPDNLIVVREGDTIVGVLFFILNEGIFLKGVPVALEVGWNVDVNLSVLKRAGHWFKLLEMFEDKAKEIGAHYITISSYMPRMDKMYLKRGYENDYSTFTKDIR